MQARLLMPLFLAALSGCTHPGSITSQVPASQLVEAQIETSTSSLSLAQIRLHQTSSARPFNPVSAPALPPAAINPVRPVATPGG